MQITVNSFTRAKAQLVVQHTRSCSSRASRVLTSADSFAVQSSPPIILPPLQASAVYGVGPLLTPLRLYTCNEERIAIGHKSQASICQDSVVRTNSARLGRSLQTDIEKCSGRPLQMPLCSTDQYIRFVGHIIPSYMCNPGIFPW